MTPIPNGLQSLASSKTSGTVAPASKSSPSWDEDWGPVSKGPTARNQPSTSKPLPTPSVLNNQPIQLASLQSESSLISSVPGQQPTASCPPVDIEWHPRASSGVTPQLGNVDKQPNTVAPSSSSFDDLDPFANWPPRPSGTSTASGTSNNGSLGSLVNNYSTSLNASKPNSMNFQANGNSSWAFNNLSSSEPLKSNQGISTLNAGNPQNSIVFMKQNQGMPALGSYNDKNSTDLGSIFGSSKNDQLEPKLAPPPSIAVGRGRGRGRGATSTSRSSHAKSQAEQPPLLDLL